MTVYLNEQLKDYNLEEVRNDYHVIESIKSAFYRQFNLDFNIDFDIIKILEFFKIYHEHEMAKIELREFIDQDNSGYICENEF